jgi:hypothetical protein
MPLSSGSILPSIRNDDRALYGGHSSLLTGAPALESDLPAKSVGFEVRGSGNTGRRARRVGRPERRFLIPKSRPNLSSSRTKSLSKPTPYSGPLWIGRLFNFAQLCELVGNSLDLP